MLDVMNVEWNTCDIAVLARMIIPLKAFRSDGLPFVGQIELGSFSAKTFVLILVVAR